MKLVISLCLGLIVSIATVFYFTGSRLEKKTNHSVSEVSSLLEAGKFKFKVYESAANDELNEIGSKMIEAVQRDLSQPPFPSELVSAGDALPSSIDGRKFGVRLEDYKKFFFAPNTAPLVAAGEEEVEIKKLRDQTYKLVTKAERLRLLNGLIFRLKDKRVLSRFGYFEPGEFAELAESESPIGRFEGLEWSFSEGEGSLSPADLKISASLYLGWSESLKSRVIHLRYRAFEKSSLAQQDLTATF